MSIRRTASSRLSVPLFSLAALAAAPFVVGCQPTAPEESADDGADDSEAVGEADSALGGSQVQEARRLFEEETFCGNGRTCLTCHSRETGTVSPAEAAARHAEDPSDPLFVHDGSDDFNGNGVSRMLADATILVPIALPPNVTLADDTTATSVVVRRGIPSTINTPALDPVLMADGHGANLPVVARGAIYGHAQANIHPTTEQLALISQHQKTPSFFSSARLLQFAHGGPPPTLPIGRTLSERRGRLWFEDAPTGPTINQNSPRKGLCATCHSGAMLNESNGLASPSLRPLYSSRGTRFQSVMVSEMNYGANPVHDFLVRQPDGTTATFTSPDPGLALVDGNFIGAPSGQSWRFKIPSLWGIKKTAPYFHDNSRKTLNAVVDHYQRFFAIVTDQDDDGDPPLIMTDRDKADLVAFLKLL